MSRLCLLFDSDGTLVDSEVLLADVMAETFSLHGLPFSAERYLQEFRGVRFHTIVSELEKGHGSLDDETRVSMEQRLRERMEARMAEELHPMPGMRESLLALRHHDCAVVSNGPPRKVHCAMQSSGLAEFFGPNLFSAYTLKRWKPDPRIYQAAACQLGYPVTQCVVIDDAAVGVQSGLRAGMHVVHYNHFPEQEATPEGAIEMLHACELPAIIARLEQEVALDH